MPQFEFEANLNVFSNAFSQTCLNKYFSYVLDKTNSLGYLSSHLIKSKSQLL